MPADRDAGEFGHRPARTNGAHQVLMHADRSQTRQDRAKTNDRIAPDAAPPRQAPMFTLGSALRWLGHDCPDERCVCTPISTLRASVWFLRGAPQSRPLAAHTRVQVEAIDIGDTRTAIRWVIYRVNGCTRRDGIEVRYQPRCADARIEALIPPQVPVTLSLRYQPTYLDEVPDPSAEDLRALTGPTR